jgi:hypothetical protein
MRSFLAMLISGVVLCSGVHSAAAASLFGTDSSGYLYKIDETNGSSTLVAGGNQNEALGLAYNSLTGVMYTTGLFNGNLSTIDLTTGATTLVGHNNFPMTGLTFSHDFSTLYSLAFNGGSLLAVNPTNGAATLIGPTNQNLLDLATNSSGALFGGGFNGIYSINPTTGATTFIGGQLSWTSIAFDGSDNLYGIEILSDALYKINPLTGAATFVGGDIGDDVRGLAFATPAVAVPGPIVGAGLPGLVMGLGGFIAWRRRRMVAV